ncbi:Metallo-hydrolase/oxidoreductase [Lentinula edodes]|uniref:Metallo-hydrolase/oxidoreductase n=1 Tax=Lentinula edodes TaxID=5353 RepID=UPI001E8E98CA|nr:Metallo-hydrolase/oxidoreductase [Lentinula edodes]KAH7873147.1 Metallo-hydrolase/oxidoreductase [Lentinula edodes]
MQVNPLPLPAQDQAYCIVSALESGHIDVPLEVFLDNAIPGSQATLPSLSFLLRHSKTNETFVFDLGFRKDLENYSSSIVKLGLEKFVRVPQDVVDSLAKGGLSPLDVKTVCLSHCHFDHYGDPSHFVNSEFVVGADSAIHFNPGFPADPDSQCPSDLLPERRTRFVELSDQPLLGPFPHALDFWGDGSLYLVDAAGHLPGHIVLIARTSPDGGWILLGGDSAHHWNLITGESQIAEGRPGFPTGCAHLDKKEAELTIQRIREFWQLPRTRVILAHDEPWYKENKDGAGFWPGHITSK